MSYKIVTDSSADMHSFGGVNFASVPLKIIADGKEFVDDAVLDVSLMMDFLASYKGKSRTSCPNMQEYLDAFGDSDNVFCVTITKNLSGSYAAAHAAAEKFKEAYPDKNIHVVDTLTAGAECALIIEKIAEFIKAGDSFEDIIRKTDEYKKHTRLIFSLESLHNLAANGRVNSIVAKISGLLGIRVIGKASDEGTLEVLEKTRGMQKAASVVYTVMKNEGYSGGRVIINDADAPEFVELLAGKIHAEFPNANLKFGKTGGLCSFYAERGGVMLGFEVE